MPVVERATITRLGEGVDRSRALLPGAVDRTLACLEVYAAEIAGARVDAVDVVGTSAMRDASPREGESSFIARATAILGVSPRIVSGDEEALLAFSGGLAGLGLAPGSVTAFDIGGGSTELIEGTVDGAPSHATLVRHRRSLDIGSVRLFERLVRSDPLGAPELAALQAHVRGELKTVAPPPDDQPLVGMAGTVTTLAAIAREVDPYDAARIHGMRISSSDLGAVARRLRTMPLPDRQRLPGLEPKRADVIPIGAVIVEEVLAWARAREITVSDRGVRWGLAQRLAARG